MICSRCHSDSSSFSIRITARGVERVCRHCTSPHARQSVANPFSALRLEHVTDESGQPVEVTSLRQLQQAERRYKFRSLVANEREADFDKPPQLRPQTLAEQMDAPFQDSEGNWHESHWMYPEVARQVLREEDMNASI